MRHAAQGYALRLVALVVLVLGIVLSPLRAAAATTPLVIAYDVPVRPTTMTVLGREDAVRRLTLATADGGERSFEATLGHPFWVDGRGWTPVRELRSGDVLSTADGVAGLVVEGWVAEPGTAQVFNLEVEGDHSYFVGADGVWVHNACGPGTAVEGMNPNILSGHGEFLSGELTVPEGTSVTVWTEHGGTISDALGNAIETGGEITPEAFPEVTGAQSYLPGSAMPNYTLSPPTGLNIMGNPTTVTTPTQLSNLVGPGMGNVQWAACLYCEP